MKKNKKPFFKALKDSFSPPPLTSKSFFVLISFILFFGLSFFLIWERHFRYVKVSVPEDVITKYKASSSPQPRKTVQPPQAPPSPLPHQLIALELIKGVLNNMISLEDLKKFIYPHRSKSWALSLTQVLDSLTEIVSYDALEAALVLPPAPESKSPSFWKSITSKIRSLVSIRKTKEGNDSSCSLQEIQSLLKAHNLSGALSLFEKLSPDQKASLSSWEKKARDRLLLEKEQKTLLLQMAEGKVE